MVAKGSQLIAGSQVLHATFGNPVGRVGCMGQVVFAPKHHYSSGLNFTSPMFRLSSLEHPCIISELDGSSWLWSSNRLKNGNSHVIAFASALQYAR